LVQHAAAAALTQQPDVLRADVTVRRRRGALAGRVRVAARPLADAASVGAAVDTAIRAEVAGITGCSLAALDVRVRVVGVTQLKRYLT